MSQLTSENIYRTGHYPTAILAPVDEILPVMVAEGLLDESNVIYYFSFVSFLFV